MQKPATTPHTKTRWKIRLVAAALCFAAIAAYHNSFSGPFIFDDDSSIKDNASIRSLGTALFPGTALTKGETASGRPLLNLSLAINYKLGGLDVRGYHAFNLFIHICAGLALFGLVRRTLLLPSMREIAGGRAALTLAAAVAALWLLHPLQTESVTYIVQRGESMMALFYILTLYCFAAAQAAKPAYSQSGRLGSLRYIAWLAASVFFCALGMATKEVMVSAPLIVLLYDRTFVSGSFREALAGRNRGRAAYIYYAALAATWLLLAACVLPAGNRGGTAGLGVETNAWNYALTQAKAVVHYLWLSIWPSTLVFDYGTGVEKSIAAVWPQLLAISALAGAALWAAFRKGASLPLRAAGFLGIFFFAVLAPSSSVVPVATQTMAEHRMYLPLAAAAVFAVCGAWHALRAFPARMRMAAPAIAVACLCVLFARQTMRRNHDYSSNVCLWEDTVKKVPLNARAHSNLSNSYIAVKRHADALRCAMDALALKPDFGEAANNAGYALAKLGRHEEALSHYRSALAMKIPLPEVLLENMGISLYRTGRITEAATVFEKAIALKPGYAPASSGLGNLYADLGRKDEAMRLFNRALEIDPKNAEAWNNRGNLHAAEGRYDEAHADYQRAVQLDPTLTLAMDNIARLLVALGRPAEALPYFEAALACEPDYAEAREHYAGALAQLGRAGEAITHYNAVLSMPPAPASATPRAGAMLALAELLLRTGQPAPAAQHFRKAAQLAPANPVAHCGLGNALLLMDRPAESIPCFQRAVTLAPAMAGAHHNLALALMDTGRPAESLPHYEAALRLTPADAPMHHNYATALAQLGRFSEAIAHEETALRLQPALSIARDTLNTLLTQK